MTRKLLAFVIVCFFTSLGYGQIYRNEWIDYSKTYYKFKVFGFGTDASNAPVTKGIVRIPFSTIFSYGLSSTPAENFQLWRDGEEVPVYTSKASGLLGASDYIEFWGEINNGKLDKDLYRDSEFQLSDRWSLQTDTASYFLTVNAAGGNKRLVAEANSIAGNLLPAENYFMHTAGRYFRTEIFNGFSAVSTQNLYSSSYDRGEGFVSRAVRVGGTNCTSNATLPQNFPNLFAYTGSDAPSMRLNINATGGGANSRSIKVNVNSVEVAHFQMDYLFDAKVEEFVPVSLIQGDAANITLTNMSTAECDDFRASKIEVTYPRTFNFGGASVFEFKLDPSSNGRFLEISNFNNNGVAPVLYDIANGKRYVGDILTPGKLKFKLQPSPEEYKLVLTTTSGTYYKTITELRQRNFVDFTSTANQGDYIIVSNPLVYGSGSENYVEQYKDYRRSAKGGNYNAIVIDIEQLVDQFAWGVKKHPLSIKNFFKYARNTFAAAPKFAFIIGKGVAYNDYRNNESNPLIEQLNLVPSWGYPASDNLLTAEFEVAIPETPIGRLSAVTPQEVGDYLKKVKEYEAAQQSTDQSLASKDWMKNVLQIAGANDVVLGNQLEGFMAEYKDIIADTAFGARVSTYSKTSNPGAYNDELISFKNKYEQGASLITYFGHSSATSLDFNLDDPQTYNNNKRYPVFIVNGCSAGNHFAFESNRFNNKTTISEKFVLAPNRGAIGYLASTHFGVVGNLDTYTQEFYKAIGKTKYNQPIGDAIKEGITTALQQYPSSDYYARVHAEEYAFHGDPAIVLNSAPLPDYLIESQNIITPSFISVADTAFLVKIKVNNIGKATGDSVTFRLNRTYPNGTTTRVVTHKFARLNLEDSITIKVPVVGNRDKGTNVLTATIDYTNEHTEVAEYNNTASKNIEISEDEIRGIYPYNLSVISQANVKLAASTVSPLYRSRNYKMELDTTQLFNSPFKITKTKFSAGGVIEFDPGFAFENNRTYYWRVAPDTTNPNWNVSSFVYRNSAAPAFEQSHVYQNMGSLLNGLSYDATTRKYNFIDKHHNLFVTHSIYPSSGLEDSHFSISVDGTTSIASACIGSSVIFNVFDPLTFKPWVNTSNPFGAAPTCKPTRENNFEYSYRSAATRKNAADFLKSIPNGAFVAVRVILDQPYDVFAADWAKDSVAYGVNGSLYHLLKANGFADIDSFNRARTFAFVFKKADASLTPVSKFTDGLFDRITLSVNAITPGTEGTVTSPKYGPAKSWSKVVWNGHGIEAGSDVPSVDVIGISADNIETVLFNLDDTKHDFNIASVSAAQYPFIKLRLNNLDTVNATPYQLDSWRVDYSPVPEGGLAPNLHFKITEPLGGGALSYTDSLKFSVAFKNVSTVNFDPMNVKLVLYDSVSGAAFNYTVAKTKPVAAGDTIHIPIGVNVSGLSGVYNVYLQVNPNNYTTEQQSFNNFLYKYVSINNVQVLPVTMLSFNAELHGADVKTSWTVDREINVKEYLVQHSKNGSVFTAIGSVAANSVASYTFMHNNAPEGKNYYRLVMVDKDGSSKLSDVQLVNVGKGILVNIYPNPVKNRLNISFNTSLNKPASLKIVNAFGQVLHQQQLAGTTQIDMSKYAAGMYILQVDDGLKISTFKVQKQ